VTFYCHVRILPHQLSTSLNQAFNEAADLRRRETTRQIGNAVPPLLHGVATVALIYLPNAYITTLLDMPLIPLLFGMQVLSTLSLKASFLL
jgi:hypothetical protein